MQKKVGIVTWICGPNYGTTLQAFALQSAIEKLGYKVFVIEDYHTIWGIKRSINHVTSKVGIDILKTKDDPSPKMVKVRAFKDKVFHYFRTLDHRGLGLALKTMDAFICGSDQMWNTWNSFDPYFYLNFAAGKKPRIAYGVSMGPASVKEEYREQVKSLVEGFHAISLREKSGAAAIIDLCGRKDVRTVLDPTLLFDKAWWTEHSRNGIKPEGEPYIACYLIAKRDDYDQILEEVKNRAGIRKAIIIPSGENPELSIKGADVQYDTGPEDFVSLIRNASLVLTDSFHGSAFSINHEVNVVNLKRFSDDDQVSQNVRLYDLYESLGIKGRFYSKDCDSWKKQIDFEEVSKRLETLREQSWNYLKQALSSI